MSASSIQWQRVLAHSTALSSEEWVGLRSERCRAGMQYPPTFFGAGQTASVCGFNFISGTASTGNIYVLGAPFLGVYPAVFRVPTATQQGEVCFNGNVLVSVAHEQASTADRYRGYQHERTEAWPAFVARNCSSHAANLLCKPSA